MSYARVDESENDDEYGDDDPADGSREPVPLLKYNWETHFWECGCDTFAFKGRCKHAIRLRKEELVKVNERFL